MITLGNEQRDYGADSLISSGKFPKTTFEEMQRLFGSKFDAEAMEKFKQQRFITNEMAADERGYVAWKVTRAPYGDAETVEEILYSEEIVGMILQYIKMLAEKQAGGFVRDCVITVPSWFTYDQRLMLKDAAEGLAGLNVL
jgi:hypoxia up-regulated 1